MQVFHKFFELPNVDKDMFLKAMSECVAVEKSRWKVEGVANSDEAASAEWSVSMVDDSLGTRPIKKNKFTSLPKEAGKRDGLRMQAFILGVHPPEERDVAAKTEYLTHCIEAALSCVPNPVPVPEGRKSTSQIYEKGQLVSFVLTPCISVVNALLGNRYVVTGASLMFFEGEEVPAQPWHLDYTPEGHEEDDKLNFTWETRAGTRGKLKRFVSSRKEDPVSMTKDCDNQFPLLFIFSFSDNYFLEHIPGPSIDHEFLGLRRKTLNMLESNKKTTALPFGSLAVFAPWCVHRGPAKVTNVDPNDEQVFRFHLFASPKTNIRGHNNDIFKVLKYPSD
jgi:hypothetical protein